MRTALPHIDNAEFVYPSGVQGAGVTAPAPPRGRAVAVAATTTTTAVVAAAAGATAEAMVGVAAVAEPRPAMARRWPTARSVLVTVVVNVAMGIPSVAATI